MSATGNPLFIRLALMAAAAGVGTLAQAPAASAQDAFIGEIRMVGFSYCPKDWLEASGQELPIKGNENLFTLLGTTYGGDGRTTFELPDLNKPGAQAVRYCIATQVIFPVRS